MRVAVLTRDFPPVIGGISTHVEGLVGALRALGAEVDIYIGRTDARTLFLPLRMRQHDYDVVHAQSGPYGAFVVGAPLVVTVHAPIVEEWTDYAGLTKFSSLPAYLLERLALRRAKAVLAVSAATETSLVRRYHLPESSISVIGNAVDVGRFNRVRGVPRVPNRILMVSRLEPRKNIDAALEALGRLPHGSYEAQVAGSGSQAARLRSKAEALGVNVRFLGRVPGSEVPRVYKSAGIFLTTSRSEGFGLSVLEAMAAGCCIVASDIPAHRSLITEGRSGFLYGTPAELDAALRSALNDSFLATRLGREAGSVARAHSWEKVARRTLSVYNSLLSSG